MANGQYLSNASINGTANVLSFVMNIMVVLRSYSKNWAFVCTLWRGIMMLLKKLICSSRSGMANPLAIDAKMSRISDAPLNLWVS